jgi:hypothetical protein
MVRYNHLSPARRQRSRCRQRHQHANNDPPSPSRRRHCMHRRKLHICRNVVWLITRLQLH